MKMNFETQPNNDERERMPNPDEGERKIDNEDFGFLYDKLFELREQLSQTQNSKDRDMISAEITFYENVMRQKDKEVTSRMQQPKNDAVYEIPDEDVEDHGKAA